MWLWNKVPTSVWLLIIIGILVCLLYKSNIQVNRYRSEANMYENTITDLNQQIKQTEIRMNDSITLYQAEVRTLNYSADNLRAKYNKLLQASKIKAKEVNTMTNVVSKIVSKDSIVALVDTFGGLKARFSDKFVKIDIAVNPDRNTIVDYEIMDSLSVINIQKRHSILFGLIKWKSLKSTRVINHNPKARIVGLETINVIE